MTQQEKLLYHQIHPAKLATDLGAGLLALVPLWHKDVILALLVAFIPAILASLLVMRFADLEKYKQSPFGKYVKQYMTRTIEAVRFLGYVVMAVGAWIHMIWVIPLGFLIVLLAWLRGVIFPSK